MKPRIPSIIAYFLVHFNTVQEIESQLLLFLRLLDESRTSPKSLVTSHLSAIVLEVLNRLIIYPYDGTEDSSRTPAGRFQLVMGHLLHITSQRHATMPRLAILRAEQDLPQRALLSIETALAREHREIESIRFFELLKSFVSVMEEDNSLYSRGTESALGPFYLRSILNSLTRTLSQGRSLVDLAIALLTHVVTNGLQMCPDEISECMHFLLSALLACGAPGTEQLSQGAVALIELMVCSEKLKVAVARLDPLPALPQLVRAREAQQEWSGHVSVLSEMQRFVQIGHGGHTSSRLSALNRLHSILVKRLENGKTEDGDLPPAIVAEVIAELHRVARSERKEAITTLVAKCLGELGVFNLCTVALTASKESAFNAPSKSKSSRHHLSSLEDTYLSIVSLHTTYLFDGNIQTVNAAARSLRHLCGSSSILALMNRTSGNPVWLMVYPFLKALPDDVSIVTSESYLPSDAISAMSSSQDGLNWTIWDRYFSSPSLWLRAVCCHILEKSIDDLVLKACFYLCSQSSRFCEQLFGVLLHNLLRNDPHHLRQQAISASFNNIFAYVQNEQSEGISLISSLLQALEYLRQCPRESSITQGTLRKSQSKEAFTSWDSNFWLEIDYLVAAKACVVSSAVFTGLFFVDLWRERCPHPSEKARKEFRKLLTAAFSSIAEPDSMDSVAYLAHIGDCLDSDLRPSVDAYVHAGKLSTALETHCRWLSASKPAQPVVDKTLSHLLLLLGYGPLLDLQLQSALKLPSKDMTPLLDCHFESAWRQRQWSLNIDTSVRYVQANLRAFFCFASDIFIIQLYVKYI